MFAGASLDENSGAFCELKANFFRLILTKAELLALTWRDIDFENSSIQIYKAVAKSKGQMILKVPKNKSSVRTLMLPQQVMDMLRQLKQEQREYVLKIGSAWKGKRGKEYDYNFLFTQWDGSLIYPTTPYSDFKKLIRNYNKTAPANAQLPDITLHDLRHPYVKPTTKKFITFFEVFRAAS